MKNITLFLLTLLVQRNFMMKCGDSDSYYIYII